ncbi:MAG: hypothetical protein IT376_11245 [Polyangiaceae bacterium]|nr:hypothetical protein [Polyangiaceae bacterium]
MVRGRERAWTAALAGLVLAVLAWTTSYRALSAPNERSRLYLAVAVVDDATFAIDGSIQRFGPILDVAGHAGRTYSDKAPGSSLPAAAVYWVASQVAPASTWSIEELVALTRRVVMIPFGVAGFLALRALLRRSRVSAGPRDVVALGWILGSSAFHYSTAVYGHQLVAVALVFALLFVLRAEGATRALDRAVAAALAGASAGFAGLTEYQAGIPAALLALYVLSGPLRRSASGLLGFVAGSLPFLLALGAYNRWCFGGVLELSYHHLANPGLANLHGQGVGGITQPQWTSFQGGILSLHRGLVPTSPFFLLALPGVWVLWARGRRRLAALLGGACLYFLLFISSSNMWVAGWGFGPRLLVPCMGWGAVLVAHGLQALGRRGWADGLCRGLFVAGVLYHQVVHAFFTEPWDPARNPLLDVVLPLWRLRLVSPNVGERVGLSGLASLAPLAVLVAVAVAVLLLRGVRSRRLAVAAWVPIAAIVPVAALALVAVTLGPTGTDASVRVFHDMVRTMSAQERGAPAVAPGR